MPKEQTKVLVSKQLRRLGKEKAFKLFLKEGLSVNDLEPIESLQELETPFFKGAPAKFVILD